MGSTAQIKPGSFFLTRPAGNRLASLLLLGVVGLAFHFLARTEAQTEQSPESPEPGKPIERELKGGEKHGYPLQLKANDYLKLEVEQKGIDVMVRLLGPDGKVSQEVDSPNGTQGPEPLSLIVEQAGKYTLEVVSVEKTAKAGKYKLKLEALHLAQDQDRATFESKTLLAKAEKLRLTGKPNEALSLATQALEKSEQVLGTEHLLVAESLTDPCSIS